MIIQKRFPNLPNEKFNGNVVWRCIGIDPDAKKVGALGGTSREEEAIIHDRIIKLTVKRSASRSKIKWQVPSRETRYSNGDVAVVYTAVEPETAVTERFHWAFKDLDTSKHAKTFAVQFVLLQLEFSGNVRSLLQEVPPCNLMVHPSDYSCCQDVGRMAADTNIELDAIVVPSARRHGGINVPIFRGDNVGAVTTVNGVTVFVDDVSCSAAIQGNMFDPRAQDVFSIVSKGA